VALLAAAAVAFAGLAPHRDSTLRSPAAGVAATAATHNLVVIVIDTLRADRLSCYGYGRPTTPCLDQFAARGLRFERAYGTAPWTLPSTASLLSGLQPEMHRGTHFFASLSPDCRLLAEQLAARGYQSAAFVGNYFVQPLFGFARGFARYDEGCMVDRGGINSDKISDAAIAWLDQHATSPRTTADGATSSPPPGAATPFLLYLHYFDPHYNYWEHDGFAFGGEDTERVFSGADIYALREHQKRFDDADRARLAALYDSEVAFTDHHVGRVLDHLRNLGREEDTYVLVTADHGEALGEHGWIGHTIQLYEESIRIPLLLAGPGIASAVHGPEPVQLDDVLEPLLRLTCGEAAGSFASGAGARIDRGLRPDEALCSVDTVGIEQSDDVPPPKSVTRHPWKLFVDQDDDGGETYRLFKQDEPKGKRKKRVEDFPAQMRELLDAHAADWAALKKERERTQATLTRRRALVQGSWKLIVDLVSGDRELYDLAADPGERHDLSDEQAARAEEMARRLDELCDALAAHALSDGPPLDPDAAAEHRKNIEKSGYSNR
jgi:arylsulfatase